MKRLTGSRWRRHTLGLVQRAVVEDKGRVELRQQAPSLRSSTLVRRLGAAMPTTAGEEPGQLSPLSRLFAAFLAVLFLTNGSLATSTAQGAAGAPVPNQAAAEPVRPPVLPVPPAPLAVSLQEPEKSARTLAAALAGPDKLAAWLGLYDALRIPVIGADGKALNGRDDPIGPAYWQVWYTAGLDLPDHGILLSDAGRLLGLLFGVPPQNAQTLGDTLLSDLQAALGSEKPAIRLLGAVARERILRCGAKRDITDGSTTAQTASIDAPMVQVVFWVALRGTLAHVLAASAAPKGGGSLAGDHAVYIAQDTTQIKDCEEGQLGDNWVRWVMGRFGTGEISDVVKEIWELEFDNAHPTIPGTVGILQSFWGASLDTIEATQKAVSYASAVTAAFSLLMQLASMDVVGLQNPDKLERTTHISNGKTATITWRLMSDPGRLPDGEKLGACVLTYLSSALGAQLTFPKDGRIAGAELRFEGGDGFPERVLFGDYKQIRSWTNESGEAELLIVGKGQEKELPNTATPVDTEYSVRVSAQPEEAGLETMAGLFFRGLSLGFAPEPGRAVESLIEMLKTFTYGMGEQVFPMIDWVDNRYEAYATGGVRQFTKKDICDFTKAFVIAGSNPGVNTIEANFSPLSSTHGNVTLTDTGLAFKYTSIFKGTYEVVFYDHGEGDIIMKGEIRTKIEGVKAEIVAQTSLRIAIRQNPDIVCPNN